MREPRPTSTSDQHSTYGTKVIPTTWREAVAVLDEIFGNPTDLPIAEHTTDTAGQTLALRGGQMCSRLVGHGVAVGASQIRAPPLLMCIQCVLEEIYRS